MFTIIINVFTIILLFLIRKTVTCKVSPDLACGLSLPMNAGSVETIDLECLLRDHCIINIVWLMKMIDVFNTHTSEYTSLMGYKDSLLVHSLKSHVSFPIYHLYMERARQQLNVNALNGR